jgi:hypothetical protein
MKQEFIDYELHLQMFIEAGADAHARYEVGEPKKPAGYDIYKQAEKEKVFQAYENELATFLRLYADDSVTNGAIKPKKPEGYDQYKKEEILKTFREYDLKLIKYHRAIDNNEKDIPEEPIKPEGYVEYVENYMKQRVGHFTDDFTEKPTGMLFDADGIPQYLSADDHYNGIENPVWTKKHAKIESKPYIAKEEITKEESLESKIKNGGWHNYDEDGIPEFLTYADRYDGIANPEWLKKHEK